MVRELNARSIMIQSIPIMIFCALIELGVGNILEGMKERVVAIAGLIVMVPPLLDLRGNINGALASRLGTALHTGVIKPKVTLSTELRVNITSSLILSFLASATIGLISFAAGSILGFKAMSMSVLLLIAMVSGMVSGLILAALTVVVSIFSYMRGWDPDNITAPIMATVGDFVTMLCIFAVAMMVG